MNSKNKKTWLIAAVGAVVVLGVIAFFVGRNFIKNKDEEKLRDEVEKLLVLDMSKDRYNTKIETSESYGKVEELIKNYLDEYALEVQKTLTMIKDENLENILTIDNLKADGKEFQTSQNFLTSYRTELNEHLDKVLSMSRENTIMARIQKENLEPYYQDLYRELMIKKVKEEIFDPYAADFEESKQMMNRLLDREEEAIQYLIDHKTNWNITDNQLIFDDQTLTDQYNEIIEKLGQIQ